MNALTTHDHWLVAKNWQFVDLMARSLSGMAEADSSEFLSDTELHDMKVVDASLIHEDCDLCALQHFPSLLMLWEAPVSDCFGN